MCGKLLEVVVSICFPGTLGEIFVFEELVFKGVEPTN